MKTSHGLLFSHEAKACLCIEPFCCEHWPSICLGLYIITPTGNLSNHQKVMYFSQPKGEGNGEQRSCFSSGTHLNICAILSKLEKHDKARFLHPSATLPENPCRHEYFICHQLRWNLGFGSWKIVFLLKGPPVNSWEGTNISPIRLNVGKYFIHRWWGIARLADLLHFVRLWASRRPSLRGFADKVYGSS